MLPILLFLSLLALHHQFVLFLLPHLKSLVWNSRLKVNTKIMGWPFPFGISYSYKAFHFFQTFYKCFLYRFKLHPTLHPTKYLHPSLPYSIPWYLPETNYVTFEFIVISKNIVIVEGFDSMGLLQNLLQYFIKNHPPLYVYVHFYLSLIRLPMYFIFRLYTYQCFLWALLTPFVVSR
jgi:hypothetical protein